MPEAKVRLSIDEQELDSRIEKLKSRFSSFYQDVAKSGGKFTDEMKKRFNELMEDQKRAQQDTSSSYNRKVQQENEKYRSGVSDSRERSFNLEEGNFDKQSRMTELNDLKNELKEMSESLKDQTKEERANRGLFKQFAKDRLLDYAQNILNQTQSYGLAAGLNPGTIFGNTLRAASLGETRMDKIKYGATGFAMSLFMEGFTKSLRDAEEMMRSMNEVRGLGVFGTGEAGDFLKGEAAEFVKYGMKGSEVARMKGRYARTAGSDPSEFYGRMFEVEKAMGVSLNSVLQYQRSFSGGNTVDAFNSMSRFMAGNYSAFQRGDFSALAEKIDQYSQLIAQALQTSNSVNSSQVAEIQAIFARGGGAGANQFASQTIMGVQGAITSSGNPAFEMLQLQAAARVAKNPGDISEIRRIRERGLFGETGREYAMNLMGLVNESSFSDRERRLVVDNLFSSIPIEERDKLLKRGFFSPAAKGDFGVDFAGLAEKNTFFGDVNEARNFNAFADIGEEELKVFSKTVDTMLSGLQKAGEVLFNAAQSMRELMNGNSVPGITKIDRKQMVQKAMKHKR